jgi:exonuclease VII small subunit
MKKTVAILGLLICLSTTAQTNFFPMLVSPANTVLMTNAEFRTFSGKKLFFKNDSGYKSFTAADLNSNVLAALGTSAAKLDSQQAALDAANQKYKEQVAAFKIEQARLQQIQAQQKADQLAQAAVARQKLLDDAKERQSRTVIIEKPRDADLNDEQKIGAFSP